MIRFGLVVAMTAIIATAVTGLFVLGAWFVWVQLWPVCCGTL